MGLTGLGATFLGYAKPTPPAPRPPAKPRRSEWGEGWWAWAGAAGAGGVDYVSFGYEWRTWKYLMSSKEQPLPEVIANTIIHASAERMSALPDRSVHLVVTSPPYNVGKEYDTDLPLDEYLCFLRRVMSEAHRALAPGGRICINIANLGRRPYLPLHRYIIADLESIGFMMRGEIIWDKAASARSSTAWGSWRSPANPTLRDVHEYILVFSKDTYRRDKPAGRNPTIGKDDFLELTRSVWQFPTASAKRVGHPAPFPVELPRRCIELYTYAGDVVLDPFMGSGTTGVAALRTGRRFVGYEVSEAYLKLAMQRLRRAGMPLIVSDKGADRP